MKRLKKAAGVLLGILMLLFIAMLCVFLFWLGPAVKFAAETVGSKALGTAVTIDALTIYPLKGTLHLSGFRIANPEKFGRSNVVSVARLDLAMDTASLFSRTVVAHRVEIDRPHFTYEQSSASDNIREFILNVQKFAGCDPSVPPDPEILEKKREKKGSKVVIVESLTVNQAQLHVAHTEDPRLDIDVAFEQLAVSMTDGTASLNNLRVGNPALLDTPNLFTLGTADIAVDPSSIYSDTVSIREVQIIRPHIYLEHNPQADTVSEFMKIAERFTAKSNAPVKPEPDIPEEPADRPPPAELQNLLIDDFQIRLLDTTAANSSAEPRMLAGVNSASVRLADGTIQINGITVPSPEGFVSSNLFHLAHIGITLEPGSEFSPQTVVQEVLIDSPTLNLEQTKTSGNVNELKETLMGFVPPPGVAEGAPTPEAAPQTGERPEPIPLTERRFVLHGLVVTNLAINLSQPVDTNFPTSTSVDDEPEPSAGIGSEPMQLIAFDRLDIAPLEGTVRMTNLQISNPSGFSNSRLVDLEQFKLDLDPDSLQSDIWLIRDIHFDNPHIAYERKIATDNIKALQDEIRKAVSRRERYAEKERAPGRDEPTEDEDAGQKVIIDHLLVEDGWVKAKISALPSAPIPLPDIELNDMGKAEGGISPGQAASIIGADFYDAIIGSVSGATGIAADALKGAGSLTLGTLDNVTGLLSGTPVSTAGDQEELPAAGEPSEPAARPDAPAEEKQPRSRLLRRNTGRFF
jgi:uncharacterized protein involved in outer membrane biogenesis